MCTSKKALKTVAPSGNCLQVRMTEVDGKRGQKPGDDVQRGRERSGLSRVPTLEALWTSPVGGIED